ncbi:MAG: SDR family oxidoreductase [Myxococcota bacterium]
MTEAVAQNLAGQTAVVTGGTRGIGAMIARALLEAGAKTYITSRKEAACAQTQAELSDFGECIAHPSDLSTTAGIEAFVDWLTQREDKIDILFNNAGATWGQAIDELTEDGWDRVMNLNVKSMFFTTQKMLPLLRAGAKLSGAGRVVNIGSIDGLTVPVLPSNIVYPVSKAAVHQLTRVLAKALVDDQITVNAIAPGPFKSKMTSFALATEEGEKMVASTIPMKRIGTPEDIGALALFLVTGGSSYITGATIPLDGGYSTLR